LWGNFFQKVPPHPFKNFHVFFMEKTGRAVRSSFAERVPHTFFVSSNSIEADDLLLGGKLPRGCKQSLRPYNPKECKFLARTSSARPYNQKECKFLAIPEKRKTQCALPCQGGGTATAVGG
jgi:hypothetical protein